MGFATSVKTETNLPATDSTSILVGDSLRDDRLNTNVIARGYYKSHRSQGKLREERGEKYSEDGGSEERGEAFSYPLILWMSSLYTVLQAWELTVSTI